MTDHTPTPWQECGHKRGGCSCGQIWSLSADVPVAKVTSGEWGDTWPALRPISSSIEGKYEVYTEMSAYGSVDPEVAKANAAFIVKAVNAHDALVKALTDLSNMYSHAWDCVNGNLVMLGSSIERFEKAHYAAQVAICAATGAPLPISDHHDADVGTAR